MQLFSDYFNSLPRLSLTGGKLDYDTWKTTEPEQQLDPDDFTYCEMYGCNFVDGICTECEAEEVNKKEETK